MSKAETVTGGADCRECFAARNPLTVTRADVGVGPYSYAGAEARPDKPL